MCWFDGYLRIDLSIKNGIKMIEKCLVFGWENKFLNKVLCIFFSFEGIYVFRILFGIVIVGL